MSILINKNYLIPIISKYETIEYGLEQLQHETIARNEEYNNNIYLLDKKDELKIYSSDGVNLYLNSFKGINQFDKKIINKYEKINYLGNDYIKKVSQNEELKKMDHLSNKMYLEIKDKKKKNIVLEEENNKYMTTDNLKDDECKKEKKEEMIKMIEDVNSLYIKELSKIKKLELNLKTLDSKLKKLEKTKKDNIINDIVRTQSEYRTWKKIKYGIKDNDEIEILKPINELVESTDVVPILFLSKFNYIEKIQNNESIVNLLNEINKIDLNELYSFEILPNENIVQFCQKYMKLSKELHYYFDDHEWSYLENEMNLNSTNKLGSNIITSKKI